MTTRIYTDGACIGNGKKTNTGGWGAVIIHKEKEKYLYGGEPNTTNNRMELMGLIKALEYLAKHTDSDLEVYCDSKYVLNGCTIWRASWIKSGYKNGTLLNIDLWKRLHALTSHFSSIKYNWIKGHTGDYYNEIADQLANKGCFSNPLGYEKQSKVVHIIT